MDKKKKPGLTPQEKIEELDDDELSQVSGGGTFDGTHNLIAMNSSRNLMSNGANIVNNQGQQRYKINRTADQSVPLPRMTRLSEGLPQQGILPE